MNEITAFGDVTGPQWASPAYDLAGNMTGAAPARRADRGLACTYDAWNRLVRVTGAAAPSPCTSTTLAAAAR